MARHRESRLDLPPRVYFRHNAYYFVRHDGKWVRLDSDYAKAMAAWARLIQPVFSCSCMNDLFDRYALQVIPSKAPRTQKDNFNELRYLRAYFGAMPAESVLPQHIAEYRDARSAKTRCNRELALLSHVFSRAVEWGIVQSNPCRDVRRNSEKPRERYVTDAEVEAFIKECPEWLKAYIELKLLLGLRKQDMLRLQWSHIQNQKLFVESLKTGKRLAFVISSEVEAVLSRLPRDSKFLFGTRSATMRTLSGFDSTWKRAMAKYVSNGNQRFHEHDLRGKVATDIGDPVHAQKVLGHKSIKMTEAYIKQRQTDTVQPHRRNK